MDFLKTIGGKIVTGVVALAVIAGGDLVVADGRVNQAELLSGTGRIVAWLGIVLVLPWAGFFLIGRVAKLESNAAGGAFGGAAHRPRSRAARLAVRLGGHGAMPWTFFAAATLLAGVYNLFTCDWIAEKVS